MRRRWRRAPTSLGFSVVAEIAFAEQPEHEVGLVRRIARVPLRWDASTVNHVVRVHVQHVAVADSNVNLVLREGEQQVGVAERREQGYSTSRR